MRSLVSSLAICVFAPSMLAGQGISISLPGAHTIDNMYAATVDARFWHLGQSEHSVAQSFSFAAASGPLRLDSWSFWLQGTNDQFVRQQLQIFETSPETPFGSLLYTSAITTPTGALQQTTFAPGIMLDPATLYLFVMNPVDITCGFCVGTTFFQRALAGSSSLRFAQGNFSQTYLLASGQGELGVYRDVTDQPFIERRSLDESLRFEVLLSEVSNVPPPTTVPEPATMLLLGSGVAGVAGVARRRKRLESNR